MRALLRLELRRQLRNRRALVFTTVLPVFFFLSFSAGGDGSRLGGLTVAPYVMVSMATYSAMNGLFSGGAIIAAERATGWVRQLRVAGLSGPAYLTTKAGISYLTALPGLLVVFLLAHLTRHVDLSAGRWLVTALAILLGLVPVVALGVLVGYSIHPNSLQPLLGLGSALLALFGGIFVPAEQFPRWLQDLVQALPTYWSARSGRAALLGGWIGWHGLAVLVAWTVGLGLLAARAYRRDSLRPSAAGTS